jgi:hypothetical protein
MIKNQITERSLNRMRKTMIVFLIVALVFAINSVCKKQKGPLPDLYVEDISCLGGNIYVVLGNQGEGPLPEGRIALASLYIDGTTQEDIVLQEASSTAQGGIAQPNGKSYYLIPYDVSKPVRVDVYIDYNEEIRESNEENNSKEGIYIGPCLLPDLAVKEIYLDGNCNVIVTVENIGPGSVPKHVWRLEEEAECTLRLICNEEEWCQVTVLDFDPSQELEPVTGIAVFPSDLKISEESAVTAIIDCSYMIQEQNEENNTKSVVLKCDS